MLKSWSVEHFKPIVNSGDLKLAPVTVLAGLNSSGKSSLLQSILMISQTLSSRVLDRSLLPNGSIVQLGTFEDILNEKSSDRTLNVGFEIDIEKEMQRSSSRSRILSPKLTPRSAKLQAKFTSANRNGASSSAIEASKVVLESVSVEINSESQTNSNILQLQFPLDSFEPIRRGFHFKLHIRKASQNEINNYLTNVNDQSQRLIPYIGDQLTYFGRFETLNKTDGEELPKDSFANLSHFLPTRFVGKFKLRERIVQFIENFLDFLFSYPGEDIPLNIATRGAPIQIDLKEPLVEEAKTRIREFCNQKNITPPFIGQNILDLVSWFRSLRTEGMKIKKKVISNKLQEIVKQSLIENNIQAKLNNSDGEGLETIVNDVYIESLDQVVEQITRFFTSKIRYLGPLRADPQATQRFAPSSELDDVGAKGEYAAAVYDANQKARIDWYNPITKQVEKSTLKDALDRWADYLGVAKQVKIEEAGQSGVSWQIVHLAGQKALPLTAVGVGVSQILPILVMGLLAPNDTLLIVEQPELHLHPQVQSRLGDFFIGLSKCKKQCLIETHSENLVNQLRYHIVTGGGQESSDCIIYFVDQDESGASQFEPIEISPNGNILNWPSGFFDESMRQEEKITAESIKNRLVSIKS